MTALPTFSVVIPTYRRPERLVACLRSLAALDYPRDRFEVIVVDDGSGAPVKTPPLPLDPAACRTRHRAQSRRGAGSWRLPRLH